MLNIEMRFKKTHPDAVTPQYAHDCDSGMDLYTLRDYVIPPLTAVKIETGIAFELPDGFEMQIRLRSGLGVTCPLVMASGIGTVDNGYRGPVFIPVRNVAYYDVIIHKGMRLAQAVLCPVYRATLVEARELSRTARGEGGFGSTGE